MEIRESSTVVYETKIFPIFGMSPETVEPPTSTFGIRVFGFVGFYVG